MKKEMLSLNSWIKEAAEWQQPLDEFLIDYNMRELECSQEDLLAKMQEMLDVMEKSVEHGLSGYQYLGQCRCKYRYDAPVPQR